MKIVYAVKRFVTSNAGWASSLAVVTLLGTAAVALPFFSGTGQRDRSAGGPPPLHGGANEPMVADRSASPAPGMGQPIVVGKGRSEAFGVETTPVLRKPWSETVRVTGRLELNASRVAHVSSLVEGVIREVCVELGQIVKQGDILAYIDSREVGEAKLQLVRDKLQRASADRLGEWQRTIHENTIALLDRLGEGMALGEIETVFRDRPVGAHREQLVSAMSRLTQATADFERVRSLGAMAVIPEKQVVRARAEYEAAAASYQALKEQIRFDARQQALEAEQVLQAAEAALAVSRSRLLILGYGEEEVDAMDPLAEAGRVAYYPLRAPIGGTVIARDAPLSRHVTEQAELVQIADLSTVWLRADVFEKDLVTARDPRRRTVAFTTGAYPGRSFNATVFSLGALVAEESRAAAMLAVVDNPDGMLKPGMFAEIEWVAHADADVMQLPTSAIQRHAGDTFVFVATGDGGYQRRDIQLGRSTAEHVEVGRGLADADLVVVRGGFALKSEMLSHLLMED